MKLFKTLTIALLLPFIVVANTGKRTGKHTKTKEIHKEFTVKTDTELIMENLYGNIDIVAWDGDKIVIDSQIIINGEVEQSVNNALNKIYIKFEKDPKKNTLSVLTKGTGEVKQHREVHFQIKVPRTNPLNIYNQYGNINIDETNANASLMASYGNIKAKKLNGNQTRLFFGYSQGSIIEYVKNGYIWGVFGDYQIDTANELFLDGISSSNAIINNVKTLKYKKCSYGSLTINNVSEKIEGESDYLSTTIHNASGKSVKIKAKSGNIEIKNLNSTNTNIETSNARLSLGYPENNPFKLDLKVYGCIVDSTIDKLPTYIKNNLVDEKGKNKEFKSYYLKKDASRNINIEMSRGILQLNKVEMPIAKN